MPAVLDWPSLTPIGSAPTIMGIRGSAKTKTRGMVTDERDWVGFGRVGDLARKELADAAHDPRMNRPAGTPIADFNDAFAEVGRARRAAILALQRTAGAKVPATGTVSERQALWELSELARAEHEGDYAWINAATVWSLHSALDTFVEQISPAVASLIARIRAQEIANQATAENPELAAQLTAGTLERVAEATATVILGNFKIGKPRGNGAVRWEGPLGRVGLAASDDRPIPRAMDRALAEFCVLRDVLSHRGGRVDQKAVDDWPSGKIEVGSFVQVSQSQARHYSAAVGAYGSEISRRLLARFSITVNVNLADWEQHGFLI